MTFKYSAIFFIFALIFQSCAGKPVVTKTEAAPPTAAPVKEPLSPKLFALLKSSGVAVQKDKYSEFIKLSDVLCKVTLPEGNRSCTFKSGTKKYTVPTKESDQLADLLFGLNLSQGDSGVATSYIECHKYTGATDVGCDVAMPLDYQKP